MELLDIAGRNPSDIALKKEIERQLREGADALTARVAELERERDVRGEEFAIALTGLQSELAAARKVDDAEVVEAVDWLLDRAECSSVTLDPSPMGPIAGLLTRLSAALKEAEARVREPVTERDVEAVRRQLLLVGYKGAAKVLHDLYGRARAAEQELVALQETTGGILTRAALIARADAAEARAQAAEAKLLGWLLAIAGGRRASIGSEGNTYCPQLSRERVDADIRALQTKDTTP